MVEPIVVKTTSGGTNSGGTNSGENNKLLNQYSGENKKWWNQ